MTYGQLYESGLWELQYLSVNTYNTAEIKYISSIFQHSAIMLMILFSCTWHTLVLECYYKNKEADFPFKDLMFLNQKTEQSGEKRRWEKEIY